MKYRYLILGIIVGTILQAALRGRKRIAQQQTMQFHIQTQRRPDQSLH